MKVNFEKAVVIMLIMIFALSTVNIFNQYINAFKPTNLEISPNDIYREKNSFLSTMIEGDKLYNEKKYKEAIVKYTSILKPDADLKDTEQKASLYFKLGMCHYLLKEYGKSAEYFLKASDNGYDKGNTYNNAALSMYLAGDTKKAKEYQEEAIKNSPAVEYYYNFARMLENEGSYEQAAKYFMAVANAEENATLVDTVRVKNKLAKLFPNEAKRSKLAEDIDIALKLKRPRDVFILDEIDMDIKGSSFDIAVTNDDGVRYLSCRYDRQKQDPYNLINEISWSVENEDLTLYKGKGDSFRLQVFKNKVYKISISIKYKGNQVRELDTHVLVNDSSKGYKISYSGFEKIKSEAQSPRLYDFAVYEQVFEKDFKISAKGYYDRFNTLWAKDNVQTEIITADFRDSGSSLVIRNTSDKAAGIRANLTTLLKDKEIRGKRIYVKFWARRIEGSAKLHINIRADQNYSLDTLELDSKWKQFNKFLDIPENANGLTLSIKIEPGDEIKLDGFTINVY